MALEQQGQEQQQLQQILETFRRFRPDGGDGVKRGEFIDVIKYLDPTWTDESLASVLNEGGSPAAGGFSLEALLGWLFGARGPAAGGEGGAGRLRRHFLPPGRFPLGKPMDLEGTGYTADADGVTYRHAASGIRVWREAAELTPEGCGDARVLFHYTTAKCFADFLAEPVVTEGAWQLLCSEGNQATASSAEPGDLDAEALAGLELRKALHCIPLIVPAAMAAAAPPAGECAATSTAAAPALPAQVRVPCGDGGPPPHLVAQGNLRRRRAGIVERLRQTLGERDTATLAAMNDYAHVLVAVGEFEEAVVVIRGMHAGFVASVGENHPDTLLAENNLAYILERAGALEEAEAHARHALAGREESLGSDHVDTLTSAYNLAELLEARKKTGEAGALYKRELEWCRKTYGAKHPHTRESARNYHRFCKQHAPESSPHPNASRRFMTAQ